MNKSFIKSGLVVIAALALASCSKTEEFKYDPDSALQIESVSGISPFAMMQEPASKAVITGDSLPGDEATKGIGLFVTAEDGSAYDGHDSGYSNVKYTYNGSKWNTTTPIYLSGSVGKLYGYFPYNADATDLHAIPVESSLNGTDYLYANPMTVSHSDKSVDLQMNHALSRLHLTIKKGENFTADASLSKITLKSTAIDASGTMDLTTGAITPAKLPAETGKVDLTTEGEITVEGIEKDILLVPADNSAGKKDITIILIIDNKSAGITLSGESGLDIRSGIQNNVILTVEDTGIKVTGVDIGVWGEGCSQQLQVGKCTVTVKLAEEQMPDLVNDIIITPKITEDKVIIEVFSKLQKRLECYLNGVASCKTRTNTIFHFEPALADEINLISYIFTISDISSDIIATIGYPRPESINLSLSSFTTYAGCSSFKLSATVLPDDASNKNFTWSSSNPSVATVDENGRVTPNVAGTANITATTVVGGITATCTVTVKPFEELIISGKFSVESSKYVNFSRGNLYYDGSRYCIEEHQYDTNPTKNADRDPNHISHFMWCDDAANARASKYNTEWNGTNKSFFAAKDFTVYDFSGWFTLSNTQWQYLLEERKTTYGTGILSENNHRYAAVKVKDMAGLLLFPDEFSWPTEAGDEPITFNTASSTWNDRNYYDAEFNVLQDNGCVFLPAAGDRDGDVGDTNVSLVGRYGNYWSSTPYGGGGGYDLDFGFGDVYPANVNGRGNAYAVRLVTDVQ